MQNESPQSENGVCDLVLIPHPYMLLLYNTFFCLQTTTLSRGIFRSLSFFTFPLFSLPFKTFPGKHHCFSWFITVNKLNSIAMASESQNWVHMVTAQTPTNIAVIKYWGKRDETLILPVNDSISVTLDPNHLCTTTTVAVSPGFQQDRMWLNGKVNFIFLLLFFLLMFCEL